MHSREVPPTPMETFRDLKPGDRLQMVTPLRRENPQAPWKFGLSNTTVTTEGSQVTGIAIQVQLDSEAQFAFERTEYRVEAGGLAWVSSVVNFNGQESATKAPVLQILPAKGPKQFLRLLYLTRRSDRDNDAALLSAPRREDLVESCEPAKPGQATKCHLIPRGVALSVLP
ncbi:MAG: hypothetical protein NW208_08440 [Bryobacter sp.]|nr:hypothetical protein [Bryobacter sp.]